MAREPEDVRLVDVLQEREASRHVSVEGRVADRELALVSSRERKPAELVREGHEEEAPDARLDVLLSDPRLRAGEDLGEHAPDRLHRGLDRELQVADAEVLGHPPRVRPRLRRGEAGRHGDADDPAGPERLRGERRRDRGVDSARDPEDDLAEPVFLDVVAQPELDRPPHLLEVVEERRDHALVRAAVPIPGGGEVDHGRIGEVALLAGERAPARVPESPSQRGRGVDLDDEESLLEGGCTGHHASLLVEDEAVPVEDELVLAPDRVYERDPAGVVPGAGREHLFSLFALAHVEGGSRDVRDDVRAGEGELGRGRTRLPDVLAHRGADERLTAPEEEEVPSWVEVAVLVEDSVVREEALVVDGLHLALGANGAGVEEVAREVRKAHQRRDSRGLGGDRLEGLRRRADESGAEQQVLGRVAGDGELRKEDEVGAGLPGLPEALHDALAVAVQVADHGVDLREREPHLSPLRL